MNETPRRTSRILPTTLALVVLAAILAGYGIWSRKANVDDLQQVASDTALPRVSETKPKPDTSEQNLTLPGEIQAWNQASIFGQVSGYVSKWDKDFGAHVKAGDVLAEIAAPSLDAQYAAAKANLDVVQARYKIADITAKRFQALSNTSSVSQQEIDDKVATAAQQKAELASSQETVHQFEAMIAFKKVVAPFDGVVTARHVDIGDFINGSGSGSSRQSSALPMFVVADVRKLRVLVSVPQTYSLLLKPDLKASLSMYGMPSKTFPAKFLATAGAVNRTTRTIVTELVLDDPPPELQPGAYVTVKLQAPGNSDVLTVPAQALLFRSKGPQIALLGDEDKVRLQSVTLGRNLGLDVQILDGVSPTDRVVANPSFGLLDGQAVKVVAPAAGYPPAAGVKNTPPVAESAANK